MRTVLFIAIGCLIVGCQGAAPEATAPPKETSVKTDGNEAKASDKELTVNPNGVEKTPGSK